jgi:hypothetical protein
MLDPPDKLSALTHSSDMVSIFMAASTISKFTQHAIPQHVVNLSAAVAPAVLNRRSVRYERQGFAEYPGGE